MTIVAMETCHATTMHVVGSTAFLHDKSLDIAQQVEQALEFFKARHHDLAERGRGSFAMLQGYFYRDIMEWLFTKGLSTRVWDRSDDVTRSRVWELFGLVLSDEEVVARGVVFPSSVTTGMIHAISIGAKGGLRDEYCDVLHHVGGVVDVLATTFPKEFVIHLEHAVTLLESALIVYKQGKDCVKGVLEAVSSLYIAHMDRYVHEKKVWEAIVVRHLSIMCEICFGDGSCGPIIKRNLEVILSHAMFSRESLVGLHQLLLEGERGSEQGHYARKLFASVDVMVGNAMKYGNDERLWKALEGFLPWLVQTFVKELESRQVEKKSSDIMLFDRCVRLVMISSSDCILAKQYAACLLALISRMPALGIYRPTEQGSRAMLTNMVDAVVDFAFTLGFTWKDDSGIVSLCIQMIAGIVVVEHRGVEERLGDFWALVETGYCTKTQDSLSMCLSSIIKEYSALRRLDVLLDSCFVAMNREQSTSLCHVMHEEAVVQSIRQSVSTILSGQSIVIINVLQRHLSNLRYGNPVSIVSLTCLILRELPLDLTIAEKVASSLHELLHSIYQPLKESIENSDVDVMSSLLTVQGEVMELYGECCRRDPIIKPLWGQNTRPQDDSYHSVFDTRAHELAIYITPEDDAQHHSLPLDTLVKRCISLDVEPFSRLAYALILTIRSCMSVLSEVRQYFLHISSNMVLHERQDEEIQHLFDMAIQIFKEAEAKNEGNAGIGSILFRHLDQRNILGELVKLCDADSLWVQTALECAVPAAKLYFIKLVLSHDQLPRIKFWNHHANVLVGISRDRVLDMTRYLDKKIARSKNKIKGKGKKRKLDDQAFDMQSALLLFPKASTNAWELGDDGRQVEKALTWMNSHTGGHDHIEYPIKGKNFSDIVLDGYREIALLCQLHHVQDDTFRSIQSVCISNVFYCALILCTTAETHVYSAVKSHMLGIMRDLDKTLHIGSSELSSSIHACPATILHLFLTWTERSIERHDDERNQNLLVLHQTVVSDIFHARALQERMLEIPQIAEPTLTRTDLGIIEGFSRALQNESIRIDTTKKFQTALNSLAAQITLAASNTKEPSHLCGLASCAAQVLEAAMVRQDSSMRDIIFPVAPKLFKACSRACTPALVSLQEIQSACLLDIVLFMRTFSKLTSYSKPRVSWEGYTNLLSLLVYNLVHCPPSVGRGYMSRPNAPKEASLFVAASDMESPTGMIRRELLKAIAILFNSSTRKECTSVFEAIKTWMKDESKARFPMGCGLYPMELLLLLLEDTGNGVLKELMHHQVDTIVISLLQDQNRYIRLGLHEEKDTIPSAQLFETVRTTLLNHGSSTSADYDTSIKPVLYVSAETVYLAFATNMRCLESILCRPRIFKKLPSRLIPSVISQVQYTVECLMLHKIASFAGRAQEASFSNACHLLIGIIRHHPDTMARAMHIMSSAISSLQYTLAARFIYSCSKNMQPSAHLMECFSRVLEEFGKTKHVQQYCSDLLISHLKFFACPLTTGSLKQITAKMQCTEILTNPMPSSDPMPSKTTLVGTMCVPLDLQNLLTPGICALYGACAIEDVQSIYAALGQGHDGSSVWRSALSNLKVVYEKHFKYIGKRGNDVIEGVENKGSWAFSKHVGAACLAFFLTCLPASAEKALTVPAAKTEELFSVQRTMVEAWTIIQDAFVDQTFNHTNWENELERHLIAVSRAQTRDQGINELKSLISDLHDPYTRWVSADEYRDFRVDTEGEIGGVGLLIANDPTTGRLLVLAPIAGSPAAKAGIHPGDELISINGSAIQGLDNEATAAQLRGSSGSSVDVEIARVTGAVPGEVGGKMTEESRLQRKKFRLKRERVQLSPIFATAVHTSDDHTYGYIRLVNFSQKASEEMRKAVTQLVKDGSEGFIVDLRNNPGGLVSSALDVASLWMDGEQRPTVFSIESKDSEPQSVKLFGTHALTDLPLTVLVNGQSASASEILAGALKDSNRGDVIGETTFGKGKIQSVFELSDGSALFVTVATYVTPNGTRIDREGIHPSFSCSLEAGTPRTSAGIPIAPGLVGTDSDIMEELENDACVKTAESDLSRRISSTATSRMTTM